MLAITPEVWDPEPILDEPQVELQEKQQCLLGRCRLSNRRPFLPSPPIAFLPASAGGGLVFSPALLCSPSPHGAAVRRQVGLVIVRDRDVAARSEMSLWACAASTQEGFTVVSPLVSWGVCTGHKAPSPVAHLQSGPKPPPRHVLPCPLSVTIELLITDDFPKGRPRKGVVTQAESCGLSSFLHL